MAGESIWYCVLQDIVAKNGNIPRARIAQNPAAAGGGGGGGAQAAAAQPAAAAPQQVNCHSPRTFSMKYIEIYVLEYKLR